MNETTMLTRRASLVLLVLLGSLWLAGCSSPVESPDKKISVAAAANLMDVFKGLGQAFQTKLGIEVVFSYASTAELSQQIDNGAPFDVFAAADTEHVDALVKKGKLDAQSRAVYAVGQLALWIPKPEESKIAELKDLTSKRVKFVAIAQPELAPYGRAAVEALTAVNLWKTVQPKIVYGNSVNMARQMAAAGSADAAFTAYSLVLHAAGTVVKIDPALHQPIEQALAVVTASKHSTAARQFREFVLGPEGQDLLIKSGYLSPPGPKP
jgi:molybdate transport system substrate-binding protein